MHGIPGHQPPIDGAALRAELVASGAIVPHDDAHSAPTAFRNALGWPVIRLDHRGRAEGEREAAEFHEQQAAYFARLERRRAAR